MPRRFPVSEVLPFPPRNRGRVRRSNSPEAMGRCSIGLLERDGEAVPANVADIRRARSEPEIGDGQIALRLALAIFATLNHQGKKRIRDAARHVARLSDGRDGDECRVLYRLLTGEQLPC